ncbi:PH domain-containing protein [Shewanella holmiensis]|uniref:PH domain-containing protein n=1 Tax=Shewanella holmiensis TaxID=2952222 RepID=A0A9X2WLF3_9GAMM|nr:PH domain-containing protein [Shewanella holmiensis]MCT7941305.1 PH domain-containing protein [Shewanella holmiensis]
MHTIALSAIDTSALYSLIGLLVGLVVIAGIILMKPMPNTAKYAAMGILLAVFSIFSVALYQSYTSQLIWDDKSVSLNVPLYAQTLDAEDIDWQGAYIADLTTQTDLKPKWRTNGLGLPGYSLGWFTLQNKRRALLSVVGAKDGSQWVMIIPTHKNYLMMISVEQPERALALLHSKNHS